MQNAEAREQEAGVAEVLAPRRRRAVQVAAPADAHLEIIEISELDLLDDEAPAPRSGTHVGLGPCEPAAEGDAASEIGPLPVAPKLSLLDGEHTVLRWLEAREGFAQRAARLRRFAEDPDAHRGARLRVERVLQRVENVLRAFDGLACDAAAIAAPALLAGDGAVDALAREIGAWIELVLGEFEAYVAEQVDGYAWGIAGRSFAELSAMHVLAQIDPRLLHLAARADDLFAENPAVHRAFQAQAQWLSQATALLAQELRRVTLGTPWDRAGWPR